MELKDIAVISGKGGLFKILKPTRTGVIVESIDEKKSRFPVPGSNRISVLEEISLYTKSSEGSTPLKKVLRKIYDEFKEDPGVQPNSDAEELRAFMQHIEPDYDEEKVYVSDIKKIVSWYHILIRSYPELLEKAGDEEKAGEADNVAAENEENSSGGPSDKKMPDEEHKNEPKSKLM